MASAGSLHPYVDVKIDEAVGHVKAGQYRPNLNNQVLNGVSQISKEWPDPLPVKRVQVFISVPDKLGSRAPVYPGGECCMRLFALSQDI